MSTFIKTGLWENNTTTKTPKGWLNLTKLIKSFIPKTKYKVFTALLTQSGGYNVQAITQEFPTDLTIGVTYTINDISITSDFTNVGAPNNNIGTSFVATGTTPNNWGTYYELLYTQGAPVATILENTIGNVWFEYSSAGEYLLKTNGNLTLSTTIANKEIFGYSQTTGVSTSFWFLHIGDEGESDYRIINTLNINTTNNTSTMENGLLNNTPIEIRVYD